MHIAVSVYTHHSLLSVLFKKIIFFWLLQMMQQQRTVYCFSLIKSYSSLMYIYVFVISGYVGYIFLSHTEKQNIKILKQRGSLTQVTVKCLHQQNASFTLFFP